MIIKACASVGLAAALLFATPALADDTETGSAAVTLLGPISLEVGDPLSFGEFAGPPGAIIDMLDNGTVNCIGMHYCGGTPAPGTFTARGDPNTGFVITSPSSIKLDDGNGNEVTIGNVRFIGTEITVVSYFRSTGVLDSSGQREFQIVGSLWAPQVPYPEGNYSGDYVVTIEYD